MRGLLPRHVSGSLPTPASLIAKRCFPLAAVRLVALVELLLFTDKTDGEATLDHGSVLLALRDHVGIQRFDSISRSLGDDRKKAVDSLLETAEKLHRATVQMVGRTDRR